MNTTKELLTSEQATNLINLVHDEYLECVIAGQTEDYAEWATFAAECIAKLIIPTQVKAPGTAS